MSKRGQYTSLTLAKKVEVISEVDKGVKKKCDIAKEYGIQPNTLSTYLKNRDKIMERWNLQDGGTRKRMRGGDYPEVDECVLKWFKQVRDHNLPLSGPAIRAKAEEFAEQMGLDSFKASSGWFAGFKERYDITFRKVCGESASVDEKQANEWFSGLSKLTADYEPKDIFNVDETGLFFKCMPDKTFSFKGERCSGGKNSKERITVLVGANMDGSEKLPMLMIGKSAKPRCFKYAKSLPVQYQANKRAWMTSELFGNWLVAFDKQLYADKRKILLFIDNCTAHKNIPQLKCITVVYFPPNMTSVVQPMDQGVIQNLKHFYRRQLVLRILDNITSKVKTKIDLLDASRMLSKAWRHITGRTIANCFSKAGFELQNVPATEGEIVAEEHAVSEIPERWEEVAANVNYDTYLDVDREVAVCGELTDREILQEVMAKNNSESSDEEEKNDKDVTENSVPTPSEAGQMLEKNQKFYRSSTAG